MVYGDCVPRLGSDAGLLDWFFSVSSQLLSTHNIDQWLCRSCCSSVGTSIFFSAFVWSWFCPRLCPSLTTLLWSAGGSTIQRSLKISPSSTYNSCFTGRKGSRCLSLLCFSQSPLAILLANHRMTSSFWVSSLIRVTTTACSVFIFYLMTLSGKGCLERNCKGSISSFPGSYMKS